MRPIASALRHAWRNVVGSGCAGCRTAGEPACRFCLLRSDATGQFISQSVAAPSLDPVWRIGRYFDGPEASPLAGALMRFKYHGDRAAGHALRLLFERAAAGLGSRYDLVVPIPLHSRRLGERGYNQAAWLARGAARGLHASLEWRVLTRMRHDAPQAASTGKARRTLKNAFETRARRIDGVSILLVDDVYTTGATAADAASTLLRAGAARVEVAVLLIAGDGRKVG